MAKPRLRGPTSGHAASPCARRLWQHRLGLRSQPSFRKTASATSAASIPVVTVGFKNTGVRRIINHYAQVETEAENLRWRYLEQREQLRQAKKTMKDTRQKSRTLIVACALKLVEKDKEIEQLRHEKAVQLSALSRQLTELQAGLLRERNRLNAAIAEKDRAIALQDRLIRRLKESSTLFGEVEEERNGKRVAVVRAFKEDSGRETDTESNTRGELFVDLDARSSSAASSSPSSMPSRSGPSSSSVSPISILRAAVSPCSTYSSLHASTITASPCFNASQTSEEMASFASLMTSPLAQMTSPLVQMPSLNKAISPKPIQRPAFCTFLEEAGMNHDPISSSKVLNSISSNNNNNINNNKNDNKNDNKTNDDLITSSNTGDDTLPLVPKSVSVNNAPISTTSKCNNLRPIMKNASKTNIPMVCNIGRNYVPTPRLSNTYRESNVCHNVPTVPNAPPNNVSAPTHVGHNNSNNNNKSIIVPTVGQVPVISPSMLANHKTFKKPSEVKSQSHRPPSKANLRTFTSDMAPLEEHQILDSGRISSITYL